MDRIQLLLQYKVFIVGFVALVLLLLERLFPAARCRVVSMLSRQIRNVSLFAINFLVSPLIVIPLSAFAARWAMDWRPIWLSGWSGLVIDLLLLDIWIYWWHRANHVVPLLWRFHEIHHLDEFLDVTSAVRFHFGEVFLSSLVRSLVIFLLAIPLFHVVIFETLVLVVTMFHHSNVKLPHIFERMLSRVVVTPAIHWVHHHAIRRDTDSNYATVLSIWDLIFTSRSKTKRSPEMAIGVEMKRDRGLLALVVQPFRPSGR